MVTSKYLLFYKQSRSETACAISLFSGRDSYLFPSQAAWTRTESDPQSSRNDADWGIFSVPVPLQASSRVKRGECLCSVLETETGRFDETEAIRLMCRQPYRTQGVTVHVCSYGVFVLCRIYCRYTSGHALRSDVVSVECRLLLLVLCSFRYIHNGTFTRTEKSPLLHKRFYNVHMTFEYWQKRYVTASSPVTACTRYIQGVSWL